MISGSVRGLNGLFLSNWRLSAYTDTFIFSLHWFKEKQLKSNVFLLYSKWSLDDIGLHNFIPLHDHSVLWVGVHVSLPLIFMGRWCSGREKHYCFSHIIWFWGVESWTKVVCGIYGNFWLVKLPMHYLLGPIS